MFMMIDVVFFIAFAITVIYLFLMVYFFSKLRKNEPEYWRSIGNPGMWDPIGQLVTLKLIFLPKKLPVEIFWRNKKTIITIRIMAAVHILCVLTLFVMVGVGQAGVVN